MKTIRKESIVPVYVEGYMPDYSTMEQGKMYISLEYQTSIHRCLCGCGEKTVLPFGKDWAWNITVKDEKVTVTPSILQQYPCRSHYIITDGVANFV